MDNNGPRDLTELIDSLLGLRCWYVSCGGAAGSTFKLALGDRVLRDTPVTNPAHTEEYRRFEGEANLLVWCAWRLDGPTAPLTSWDDERSNVEAQLDRLRDATIESVQLIPPAWELSIGFSNGLSLRVFCDHVPGDPSFDGNWDLSLREKAIYVGPGARCRIEERARHVGAATPTEG